MPFPVGFAGILVTVALHLLSFDLAAETETTPRKLDHIPDRQLLSLVQPFTITGFRLEGNTVFNDSVLQAIVAPSIGQKTGSGAMEEARLAISRHYAVTNAYVNSGAIIRDQVATNGVVTINIVEGRITEINLTGNKHLRASFLKRRLARATRGALNRDTLRNELEVIQEEPTIETLEANLKPGLRRGESSLDLVLKETQPFFASFEANNHRPASVGAETLRLTAGHRSLVGRGDTLGIRINLSDRTHHGFRTALWDNFGVSYEFPVNTRGTALSLAYQRTDYAVIEEPFDELDIESGSETYSAGISQNFVNRLNEKLSSNLSFDWRDSQSELLGTPYSFSPGAVDGEANIRALRWTSDYLIRHQTWLFAARSSLALGLPVFNSTDNGSDQDGEFVSWSGQVQYIKRLTTSGHQIMGRLSGQWSNSPLLSLEQFSLGGARTVRGYRENQLVRDTGVNLSLEYRLPIWRSRRDREWVQLAPFFDLGAGWNRNNQVGAPHSIASAGVGVIVTPTDSITGELYWGHGFREFDHTRRDLQDAGIHFRLHVSAL